MKAHFFILFIFLLFGVKQANASLNTLVDSLEKSSHVFELNEKTIELNKLDSKLLSSQRSWTLKGNITHSDSFKDSFFSFQALRTISDTASLALEKPFDWGGAFKIEQGVRRYNLSKWGASTNPLFSSTNLGENPFEYYGLITYSQDLSRDIWGKSYDLDLALLEKELAFKKKEASFEEEQLRANITRLYLNAKYSLSLMGISKKNISRAKKLEDLVRRRVRDGLRLKVDLLQAENLYIRQKELFSEYDLQKEASLQELSLLMEREVRESEILVFKSRKKYSFWDLGDWKIEQNLEVEKSQLLLEKMDVLLKKTQRSSKPDIKFQASLGTNAIEEDFNKSFKEGNITSRYQEKLVSLNVVIPLGYKANKIELQKQNIQKNLQEIQLEVLKKNLDLKVEFLRKKIKLYEKNLLSIHKRLNLSQKMINEYEELYAQGRVNLDTLLSAEETLRANEMALFQSLFSYESLVLEFAVITNNISRYIDVYKG